MIAALTPAMAALSEVMAKHTKCEVDAITVQGDAATLTVKITRPELEQASAFAKLGELAKAETPEARRDKVEEWVKASTKTATATHSVQFVKTPEGWKANFDLKARAEAKKREQALAELQQLREKKAQAMTVQAELSKFVVSQPRFYKKKQMFGVKPIIEMSVQNGTAHAISRVVMRGTLASPGRSVPWTASRSTS